MESRAFQRMTQMEKLITEIQQKLQEQGRLIVAIDGRCGCGKSSLAERLAKELDGNVFHMDDFYLPFVKRPENWQQIPAGNMDLSRFRAQVLEPLLAGESILYRAYACPQDQYRPAVELPIKPLSIVEGSYSQHPFLADAYDYKLFVTADKTAQTERLRNREGEHFTAFEAIWMPMEEAYFRAFSVAEQADRIIYTDIPPKGDSL